MRVKNYHGIIAEPLFLNFKTRAIIYEATISWDTGVLNYINNHLSGRSYRSHLIVDDNEAIVLVVSRRGVKSV